MTPYQPSNLPPIAQHAQAGAATRSARRPTVQRTHVAVEERPAECEQHGAYVSQRLALDPPVKPRHMHADLGDAWFLAPFWTACPRCDAEAQREVDDRDAEIRGGLTAKQRAVAAAMREAEIPDRFLECSLDSWVQYLPGQKKALRWARDYVNTFTEALETGRSAIFTGTPGTGKTHLAVAIAKVVMQRGGTARYSTVMRMLSRIKATYSPKFAVESEEQAIAAFTTPDLLVLDEVGRQLDSGYEHAQMFRILNDRHNARKPTIMASNLTAPEVREFLGEAVLDRLREAGGSMQAFNWPSHRGRAE